MSSSVLDRLVDLLDSASDHDSNAVAAPIAVLWPDEGRQWGPVVDELRSVRTVLTLGAYEPEQWQGPAYWIRCVISGTIELDGLADDAVDHIPIVYLPGVSRDHLRTLDEISPELAPLGALPHRCQWFSHPNGKDWTVRSLLSNLERGLGLNVASGGATAAALARGVRELLDQPWARLESRRIDAAFVNDLLSPDPVRSLLEFLEDPVAMRNALDEATWAAFTRQCKQDFGYDPADSEIEGARLLGEGKGQWAKVWRRFRDNPSEFPNLPERLRRAAPDMLFDAHPTPWPQFNERDEEQLQKELLDLPVLAPAGARNHLRGLDERHRDRRNSVWAQLGKAPLALALEHLAEVAEVTSQPLPPASVEGLAGWFAEIGWRADRAAIAALQEVRDKADVAAVEAALIATYRPWLEEVARALQEAIGPAANAGTYEATSAPTVEAGQVVIFIDGLRLDVGHQLEERLRGSGLEVQMAAGLAALPTVTQTAKPALIPVDQSQLCAGKELDARRAPDGPSAGIRVLRALMKDAGFQVLSDDETGDPSGRAWTETGKLDSRGHELGLELVYEITEQVERMARRISELVDAGWSQVRIVTDHGWLLVPGGLPKDESLDVAETVKRKGRCARVADGANPSAPTVPWHWDSDVRIALAPGIACFEANKTYEHGGVSPQECVVPRMVVSGKAGLSTGATLTSIKWRGLTLVIEFDLLPEGAKVDLRTTAGDPNSSIAEMGRVTGGKGKVILLVGDEDLEGEQAQIVVAATDGTLILQRATTVGQNR